MKKFFIFILLVIICFCGYAQTIDPVLVQEMEQRTNDEKIKVIVIMKSQYDRQQLGRSAAHYATRAERREFVVNELKQFAETSQHELRSTLSEMERQDMTTAPKIIYMANALYFSATKQAINDLAMRRDIELIGLDEKKHVLFDEEPRPANITREITSNVTQVNADQVWSMGYTGQGVVVAVIDTGVNYNHLDLADHLWYGGSEYPYHGYNFAYESLDPMDDHGHGTHCAGTVCGDGTAGQQTGMAPDATLMCVKVLDDMGYGYASVTCTAMQWAVEQGCDLFSMSLGWNDATLTERMLFRNTCAAILDAGVIGAIAAGNNGNIQYMYPIPNNVGAPGSCPPPYMDPVQENNPGGLSCALCVGAVDDNEEAAYFTSQGPVTWSDTEFGDYPYMEGSSTEFGLIRPDVCAPGVDIISADLWDNSGYTMKSGTSMATPCVAGCISLLLSKNIDATPAEICQILEETAVPLEEGKSNTYGHGRVDALAAINALQIGPLKFESFAVNDMQGNNDGKLNAGESVTLDLTLTNDSDNTLNGATLVLSTASEYVTITNGTAMLPHFDAGQTQTIESIFEFSLSYGAPGNRAIHFTAEAFVNGESIGIIGFSVLVYGYVLKFDEVTVLNDNNGNGVLEPGETADLHVVISNVGYDSATGVWGYLDTQFPYIIIDHSTGGSFGNVEVNGQVSTNFTVTLSYDAPERYIIDFSLHVGTNNSMYNILFFELVNGYIVFADPQVKAICVYLGDADDDGELTYEEAASVTDLHHHFQYNSTITSFDELQYFTGLSSIGNGAFTGCSRLKSIVLPESITSIGEEAFYMCERMTGSLNIPNSVTTIGVAAFAGCLSLTGSLTIPNSVTEISNYAFHACDSLTSVIIGNSVTSVGINAFDCWGLNAVYYMGDIHQWCDIQFFDILSNPLYCGKNLFIDNELVTDLVIPETVTEIKPYAFIGASCLTSLTIGNSVSSIGEGAFEACNGLTSLTIGNSVDSISYRAFYGCRSLTSLIIGNSVTYIGEYAFDDCSNIFCIASLAETPPSLDNYTFGSLSSNTVVYVPCGFEDVYVSFSWGGFNNFYGICGGTVTVTADPEEGGVVSGGGTFEANQTCTVTATPNPGYAFGNWILNGMMVSNSAEYTFCVIDDMTMVAHFVPDDNIIFDDSNVKTICVSHWDTNGDGELSYVEAASVTSLGNVFNGNGEIISFDELQYFIGLSSIGDNAFINCTELTSIVLPSTLKSIDEYAFIHCSSLTGLLTIPNSVTSIGKFAFGYCSGLTSLIIGNSVTSIRESAFSCCISLTTITIGNSVRYIGASAFDGCSGLNTVYYTGDINQWCNIYFGNSWTNPLSYAHNLFIDNELVTDLMIPETVTKIKQFAFHGATCVTSLTIPESVTSIEQWAFSGCTGLTSMTVLAEMPPTMSNSASIFANVDKSIPIHVPCGSLEAYQNAEGWNEFTNFQEDCTQTQTITLSPGWTWWSTYLDITLADLEAALGSNGVSIVSQEGIVSYYEDFGWDGNFNTLSPSKMYRLQVESDCSLELSGNAVNPADHTITLAPGINWIGFPVSQSMLISDALQGFTPTIGDVIKTFNGMTTFIGSGWMGTFNTLDPGKGYIYYSNANEVKTFVFTSGR